MKNNGKLVLKNSMHVTLRSWQLDDCESLAQLGNDTDIARFMTDAFPHPYTLEKAKSFIEKTLQDNPPKIFAITMDDIIVGGIGIFPQADIMRKNAEIGYWIGKVYWGKGIATTAIAQIVEYGFNTFDITRIYARPYGNNIASQKVLQKAGFTLEAKIEKNIFKNDEFLDELIYAVRK